MLKTRLICPRFVFALPVEGKAVTMPKKHRKTRVFKNIARNVCFHKTKAFRSSFCQKYTETVVFYGCFATFWLLVKSLFALPVNEKGSSCPCDGLSPLPVEEKAIM